MIDDCGPPAPPALGAWTSAWSRRRLRSRTLRATNRLTVGITWAGSLTGLVLLLHGGPVDTPREMIQVGALVASMVAACPLLFVPERLLAAAVVGMQCVLPWLMVVFQTSAREPSVALASAIFFCCVAAFNFSLWGPRIGSALTAVVLVALATSAALGPLPPFHAVSIGLTVVSIGALFGWDAHRAERVEEDALTGLRNERGLLHRLEDAAADAAAPPLCLVMLDVDRLRQVDAVLGPVATDVLLQRTADLLSRVHSWGGEAFHLGSGTFAVVQPSPGLALPAVAEALRAGLPEGLSVSAGAAVSAPGETAGLFLARARASLAGAKAAGGGVLDPALLGRTMAHELAEGLHGGQIRVVYQPIVDLADGRTVGAEALARWDHPERGIISPDVFVPAAEESGLVHDLGRFVLGQACAALARADATGANRLRVGINASVLELRRPDYAQTVLAALQVAGLTPDRLTVEITESSVADDELEVAATLSCLRERGVLVAIDDFGTGYSSLSRLGRLPVDILKIDKSFVWNAERHGRDAVLTAITSLSRAFELTTVAEGIETWDHADVLRGLGCDYGQGYLYGRPGTFEDLSRVPASPAEVHP